MPNTTNKLNNRKRQPAYLAVTAALLNRPLIKYGLIPTLVYAALFVVLSYPLITRFNLSVFSDNQDSLQNVWNLWWFKQAAESSKINLWETDMLFHPFGTSLIGHALSPLNGFQSWLLQSFFPLVQTYNTLIILGFVLSGLSMFLLAWYLIRSYVPSLMAGFWFTFSAYHWSQGQSHLELHSTQWLIMFVLTWVVFLKKPATVRALISAFMLRLVLWNTPYHFLYGLVIALILLVAKLIGQRRLQPPLKKVLLPTAVFFTTVFLTSYNQLNGIVDLSRSTLLTKPHDPTYYSLDLLGYFIPGYGWRFNHLTESYWSKIQGGPHEAATFIGWTVISLAVYSLFQKRSQRLYLLSGWLVMLIIFTLFALGPFPKIWGSVYYPQLSPDHPVTMPYEWLGRIFPQIHLSGVPLRAVVVVITAASLLAASGLAYLWRQKKYLLVGAIIMLAVLERIPPSWQPIDATVPEYVPYLKSLPQGGVLDMSVGSEFESINEAFAMYYQTIHGHPITGGYLSRVPEDIYQKSRQAEELWAQQDYRSLCRIYHTRYVLDINKPAGSSPDLKQATINFFDLTTFPECALESDGD